MARALLARAAVIALVMTGCRSLNPDFDFDGGNSGGATRGSDGTTSSTQPTGSYSGAVASGDGSDGTTSADATGSDDSTPITTTSGSSSTTAAPEPPRVLLVTQLGDASLPLDATLLAALDSIGATVTLAEDELADDSDAQDVDVVVISETASSGSVGNKFRDTERPVISLESVIWTDMGMAPAGGFISGTTMLIADPDHPIASGLVGEVEILVDDPASGISVTVPSPAADIIAVNPSDPGWATVFAYEAGDMMDDGSIAPAARIGFGADVDGGGGMASSGDLSPQGAAMFLAAMDWVW